MHNLRIIIVTGLSGSGKSIAINALEDSGYYCVDNMPIMLLPKFLELRSGNASEVQKLAFGMDLREREFIARYREVFTALREQGYRIEVLFLEASEEVLIKRYSQTRRKHPVSEGTHLLDSIRRETEELKGLKAYADKVIDTSNTNVHELKQALLKYADHVGDGSRMKIGVVSFGFKFGIPLEADLVVDVRFIPNPYFVPELKHLDGTDDRIRQFVLKWPETTAFLERYLQLLDYLLPLYEREGKSYLTLAVGCTGGRHRSVTLAAEITRHLKQSALGVSLIHRDIALA